MKTRATPMLYIYIPSRTPRRNAQGRAHFYHGISRDWDCVDSHRLQDFSAHLHGRGSCDGRYYPTRFEDGWHGATWWSGSNRMRQPHWSASLVSAHQIQTLHPIVWEVPRCFSTIGAPGGSLFTNPTPPCVQVDLSYDVHMVWRRTCSELAISDGVSSSEAPLKRPLGPWEQVPRPV